jgi:hypothetical protein
MQIPDKAPCRRALPSARCNYNISLLLARNVEHGVNLRPLSQMAERFETFGYMEGERVDDEKQPLICTMLYLNVVMGSSGRRG